MTLLQSLLVINCVVLELIYSKSPSCDTHGVNPEECHKYKTSEKFFFCGGSKDRKIPMKYVNDDYCDCVGSNDDEPGTSACNHGKFWCKNSGYRGRFIYSSLVNDGICDCCDGSDELNNPRMNCPNRCNEKAKAEIAEIIQSRKKYMEGIKVKNSLLQVAKSKLNEKKSRKQEIEQELGQKREELKQKEEIKKVAEEKEREYRDQKKKKEEEEKERKKQERIAQCIADGGENCEDEPQPDTPSNDDDNNNDDNDNNDNQNEEENREETPRERRRRERRERHEQRAARNKERREKRRQQREEAAKRAEDAAKAAEAAEEAANEIIDKEGHHVHTPDEEFPYPEQYRPHDESEGEGDKPIEHTPDEEFPYPEQYRPHDENEEQQSDDGEKKNEEDGDGFDWSEFDDEEDEDEDIYVPPPEEEEEPEPADPVMDELSNDDEKRGIFGSIYDGIMNGFKSVTNMIFGDNNNKNDNKKQRNDKNPYSQAARDARNDYNNLNRDIRNLEKDIEDINKVLEMDFGEKNIYASLFDECYSTKIQKYDYEFCPFGKAKQKEGSSSTDLGSFKSFGFNNKGELVMTFEDGQKCWNGPKRSANIFFKCDTENEIVSVQEPSTCKYHYTFHTPLACQQSELDRLTDLIQNQFKTEL